MSKIKEFSQRNKLSQDKNVYSRTRSNFPRQERQNIIDKKINILTTVGINFEQNMTLLDNLLLTFNFIYIITLQ